MEGNRTNAACHIIRLHRPAIGRRRLDARECKGRSVPPFDRNPMPDKLRSGRGDTYLAEALWPRGARLSPNRRADSSFAKMGGGAGGFLQTQPALFRCRPAGGYNPTNVCLGHDLAKTCRSPFHPEGSGRSRPHSGHGDSTQDHSKANISSTSSVRNRRCLLVRYEMVEKTTGQRFQLVPIGDAKHQAADGPRICHAQADQWQ